MLRIFTEGDYDESYVSDIYSINQDNVPEVGSLDSLDQQRKLLSLTSPHWQLVTSPQFRPTATLVFQAV